MSEPQVAEGQPQAESISPATDPATDALLEGEQRLEALRQMIEAQNANIVANGQESRERLKQAVRETLNSPAPSVVVAPDGLDADLENAFDALQGSPSSQSIVLQLQIVRMLTKVSQQLSQLLQQQPN